MVGPRAARSHHPLRPFIVGWKAHTTRVLKKLKRSGVTLADLTFTLSGSAGISLIHENHRIEVPLKRRADCAHPEQRGMVNMKRRENIAQTTEALVASIVRCLRSGAVAMPCALVELTIVVSQTRGFTLPGSRRNDSLLRRSQGTLRFGSRLGPKARSNHTRSHIEHR